MKNVRLNLEVPAPTAQGTAAQAGSNAFVRVGVVALVGFGVGVAWPRAMGLQLGPAPIPSLAASAEPEVREMLNAAGAGSTAPTSTSAPSAAPPPSGPVSVVIAKGVVLSCRNSDGETLRGRECGGAPKGMDPFVAPHLSKLSTCSGAAGQQGKLSAVVTFDFRASRLSVEVGKSSTVPSPEPLGKCLKEAFTGVDLPNIPHEHNRYAMAYSVQFDGSTKSAPSASGTASAPATNAEPPDESPSDSAPAASGSGTPSGPIIAGSTAELEWDPTRVRNAPRTGEIIARWPKGTKVTILSQQGGWLKVKREGTSDEGWVYRSALGK
ncbi:MAG: SH3 domain-containing protein [Polyangiaceae bacterium]